MELIEKVVEATPELFNFDLEKFQLIVNDVTIPIVGTYDEPWFSGNELCMVMGYKNVKQTLINNIKAKHKTTLTELKKVEQSDCSTFFRPFSKKLSFNDGKAVYISEQGVYHLAMKCQLPIGEKFREWLADEVVPSIRKTGQYKLRESFNSQLAFKDKLQEKILDLCEKVAVMTVRDDTKHVFQIYKYQSNNEYVFIRTQSKSLSQAIKAVNHEIFEMLFDEVNVPNSINILNRLKEKLRGQKIFFEAKNNKLTVDADVLGMVGELIDESRT